MPAAAAGKMRIGNGATNSKRRGRNKRRDPTKPKRPPSAYNIAMRHLHPAATAEVQAEGSFSYGDVVKRIGEKWRAMGPAERAPHIAEAAAGKAKYEADMKVWRAKQPGAAHPDQPKKPLSAYMRFVAERKGDVVAAVGSSGAPVKVGEVMKRVAAMWRGLSEAERAPLLAQANKAKKAYRAAMAAFEKKHGAEVAEAKKLKALKRKGRPNKPGSAYIQFGKAQRAAVRARLGAGADLCTDVNAEIANMWRGLSEEERAPYRKQEREALQEYETAVVKWKGEQKQAEEARWKQAHPTERTRVWLEQQEAEAEAFKQGNVRLTQKEKEVVLAFKAKCASSSPSKAKKPAAAKKTKKV